MSRDDKSGEFISREFDDFCASEGIMRQHTEPDEPHQNGVAEWANRDIAEGATALFFERNDGNRSMIDLESSFNCLFISKRKIQDRPGVKLQLLGNS